MFRTSQHPQLIEAARQAELLHRFRIKRYDAQWALWLNKNGWKRIGMFATRQEAETYLASKLPQIETTPGDINRQPPLEPDPPGYFWGI